MKRIYDGSFKYVPASKTDIRKTFARIRKQMKENEREKQQKVEPINARRKTA